MPPPANLPAPAAAAAPPRPRMRLLPRWLRRLPLPLLLLHSRLLDGLDVGPPAPPARSTCSSRTIHHCTVVKPLRSTCSSRLRRGPGSNSAVSSLSIRAIRMAEAWAGDALPGSCAMSMGCSRSEHASLQQAHAIRGSARGRGPGCGRNSPSCSRAHLSARCASSDARQKNSVCLPIDTQAMPCGVT